MPVKLSFGNVQLGVTPEASSSAERPAEETPFRIVVLGDFSGKGSRGVNDPAKLRSLKPLAIDRDNFEDVMARLGIELHVGSGDGTRMTIRIKELDDFRPDRLLGQVEVFDKLQATRKKLSNPATFAAAAAEIGTWGKSEPSAAPAPAPAPAADVKLPSGENLLEQILGETQARQQETSAELGGVDWNNFLRKVVSSYVVPREDPRQAEMVSLVDDATSGLMRALLHQPDFQGLEAAWRGLYFLIRRLDTDANLKLSLLDISRAELAADLMASDDLTRSALYRLIVEQTVGTPGAKPWSLLTGNYTFAASAADAELLGRLAMIARRAGAPFLAAAHSTVVGCPSFGTSTDPDSWKKLDADAQEAWGAVRNLGEASYLGLAMPRFLLRLPYGKNTDPVDNFDFEEVTGPSSHDGYLWGNPAIACTYLLAEAFSRQGWDMRPGSIADIEGLPLHVYEDDGESVAKPCAEAVLGSRASAAIDEAGVMPLLSVQGRDAARLDRIRSLAHDGELSGRWE